MFNTYSYDIYKRTKQDYIALSQINNDFRITSEHSSLVLNKMSGGDNHLDEIMDFYFVHSTFSPETMIKILEDGFLRPSEQLHDAKIYMSEGNLPYIYTNINFADLNNIDVVGGCKFFLSPQLFFDSNTFFNQGWFKYPRNTSIHTKKTESTIKKKRKLRKIKKYLKNPTFYPKNLTKNAGYIAHEILFDEMIDLHKYLIGVECDFCETKYVNSIEKIIKNKYPHVKIFKGDKSKTSIEPPPVSFFKK
jgi:hypothetical protein